jgi:hypothetical protein
MQNEEIDKELNELKSDPADLREDMSSRLKTLKKACTVLGASPGLRDILLGRRRRAADTPAPGTERRKRRS